VLEYILKEAIPEEIDPEGYHGADQTRRQTLVHATDPFLLNHLSQVVKSPDLFIRSALLVNRSLHASPQVFDRVKHQTCEEATRGTREGVDENLKHPLEVLGCDGLTLCC
jgi:hypothetical protein